MAIDMKKPGMLKNLIITGQLTRFTIYLAAAIPATIFIIMALLVQVGVIGPLVLGPISIGTLQNFLFLQLFLVLEHLAYTRLFVCEGYVR